MIELVLKLNNTSSVVGFGCAGWAKLQSTKTPAVRGAPDSVLGLFILLSECNLMNLIKLKSTFIAYALNSFMKPECVG